jgi:hypothetical protein
MARGSMERRAQGLLFACMLAVWLPGCALGREAPEASRAAEERVFTASMDGSASEAPRDGASQTGAPIMAELHLERVPLDDRFRGYIPTGTFDPRRKIFPVVKKGVYDQRGRRAAQLKGIPDSLQDVRVLHDFVDREQFFYQAYKAGDISPSLWSELAAGIDTTALVPHWVDGVVISVLTGSTRDGRRVVLVDRDNDGDFSGEEPLEFRRDTLRLPGDGRRPIMSAETAVRITYVDVGTEHQRVARLRFFYDDEANPETLVWQPVDYLAGTLTLRGETFSAALYPYPVLRPGKFTFLYVDVDGDGRFDPDPAGVEAYSTDEPFNLGGITWGIQRLAADGSEISLAPADTTVEPRSALGVGGRGLPFTARTLDGEPVSVDDPPGRYVLLNFAWDGCVFSFAELPYLKAAWTEHGSGALDLLSIVEAAGETALRTYVESHELKWPHINQGRSDEIGRLYRVTGSPTNYLIGPDGVILATGNALRGDSLRITLEKYLRQPNQE